MRRNFFSGWLLLIKGSFLNILYYIFYVLLNYHSSTTLVVNLQIQVHNTTFKQQISHKLQNPGDKVCKVVKC